MGRSLLSLLFAALLGMGWSATASADSPLTSTTFHGAYGDVPLVAEAAGQGLTPGVMAGLSDPAVPHDVRAAAVNALGWSLGGQRNAQRYVAFLSQARRRAPGPVRVQDLTAEEAMALGYMRALDDYLELRPIGGQGPLGRATPLSLLDHAVAQAPNDRAVALVRGLVAAQLDLHKDRWCRSYRAVFDVLDADPTPVLRPAAQRIVADYMRLYRSYC